MARLDKDLTESQLASLMFDVGERARIETLLLSLRPGVLRMVNTTLGSLAECKEAFELSIINPVESLRLHGKNALTIDGLKRFFSVDGDNQSRFFLVSSRIMNNIGLSSPGSPATSEESPTLTFLSGSGAISSVRKPSS